jgi:hypothetical protein
MAASTTGKIAEVIFENAVETHEEQTQILGLVDSFTPASGGMQNSNNFVWRGVQQHRPVLSGWDLTGQEQGVIQETYPAILGTPTNDLVELRADDLRDPYFWAEAGKESGRKQGAILNKTVADVITNTGSLAYRTNTTSGFNFIAQAQTIMDERQAMADQRKFILSPRDNLAFATELSGRQTVQGRPATVWESGQLAQNVAGFDVYTGSYLSTIAGGADPATTVTANVSLKPEAGSVSATGVVTNIDYRVGTILVTSSAAYNVGDIVTFANGGVTVKAVGLTDKTVTDQAMTFRIVAKPNGTSVQVYPKPIAVNDPALSALEQAYGNINTRILSTATMNRVNIDALARPSVFFDKKSIEVFHGEIPAQYFNQFGGQRVTSATLKSGQKMYMLYDANSTTMNFKFRIFTWYAATNRNPSANGVAIRF